MAQPALQVMALPQLTRVSTDLEQEPKALLPRLVCSFSSILPCLTYFFLYLLGKLELVLNVILEPELPVYFIAVKQIPLSSERRCIVWASHKHLVN